MILALYLTPALLAILLVGGIGLLVLAVARTITWIVCGRPLKASSKGFEG
jgi:hypothetical protein